jgi:hypothetical protein
LLALLCQIMQPANAQTPAASEDKHYDVELLIFKYSNPDVYGAEHWPQYWVLPDTKNSVDLNNIDDKHQSDFQSLGTQPLTFGGMLERLDKSVRYETLSYTAWRQRGLDKEQAVSVRIRGGRKYLPLTPVTPGVEFGLFEQSYEQGFVPEVLVRKYTETPAAAGSALHELEGGVKIVLGRYLHIHTNLLLLKPVTLTPVDTAAREADGMGTSAGDDNPGGVYSIAWAETATPDLAVKNENAIETLHGFNIKAHRRMRSGELHHIDHPLLGVLVQIKPVETKP